MPRRIFRNSEDTRAIRAERTACEAIRRIAGGTVRTVARMRANSSMPPPSRSAKLWPSCLPTYGQAQGLPSVVIAVQSPFLTSAPARPEATREALDAYGMPYDARASRQD